MIRVRRFLLCALLSFGAPAAGAVQNGPPVGPQQRGTTAQAVSGTGSVTSLDATAKTFVVRPQSGRSVSVSVTTTEETQWVNADGSKATFSDLASGTMVGILGQVGRAGGLTAQKVYVFVTATSGTTATAGAISRIDANARTLVVHSGTSAGGSTTWSVTPNTLIQRCDGSAANLSDLTASVEVGVQGTSNGSGATAQKVIVFGASAAPVSGSGTVTRVDRSYNAFQVQPQGGGSPVTVTVSASTQFSATDGSSASFAALTPGMQVQIQGMAASTGVAAERVMLAAQARAQQNRGGPSGGFGPGQGGQRGRGR